MKSRRRPIGRSIACLLLAGALLCGCEAHSNKAQAALPLTPRPLAANAVAKNPYMGERDAIIHNDAYSSDVTDAVMPLGLDAELRVSLETTNQQAPSSVIYDADGCAITQLTGGLALTQLDGESITRLGSFVPSRDDAGQYVLQTSYAFVDNQDHVIAPTSHGHVLALRTKDEQGNVLPVFEKIMDVDIGALAKQALGNDLDTRLLSIVYDYQGNLWFVTGGFRVYPDKGQPGFLGYLSREYIQGALAGAAPDAADHLFFYKLDVGEGAENGASSNEDGAVILTNKACYMLRANGGVEVAWKTPYESDGANDAQQGSGYTGGGLAWGSGTTPTLTRDLVLFTDNRDPVHLLALSSKTGELLAETPVLDELPEGTPVSVENSILVYSADGENASVILCNWFGAGNAGLASEDADSSVQSYENIYDANWTNEGGKYLAPGMERVDVVKQGDAYTMKRVWLREDVRDTSMVKLSTATGYLYGYWQNMDTGMWGYQTLDFDTGETLWEQPVSSLASYNNMAVGVIPDVRGNALYCPTNQMEMLRLQDVFAYLPQTPAKALDADRMQRERLSAVDFEKRSGEALAPATYLMRAVVQNPGQSNTIAFKVNGLRGKVSQYSLFTEDAQANLVRMDGGWSLTNDSGEPLDAQAQLEPTAVYEIRYSFEGRKLQAGQPAQAADVTLSAILASKA